MALDLAITGGMLVDGTGSAPQRADIGISNGHIVEIGEVSSDAERIIDATDLVVSPGFIDLHTHYDAQAFWDNTLSPSPMHGVTTVIGGNCGFTIAPLTPQDGDYLMRMLARVEGMPLESLQEGVPWNWNTTAEYLDALDGTLLPNAAFLVGHSALRRVVMHDDATKREATPSEVQQMVELLRAGLKAGAMGFSSTWSTSHNDHTGVPVPSRHASREELLALCAEVRHHEGTTLEFIPAVGQFSDETFELMGDMSAAANRPLNWNLLQVYAQNWELVQHQLAGFDIASRRGGHVLALTLPDTFRLRLNFKSGFILDILSGWDSLMALPDEEKLALMASPDGRARMNALAQATEGPTRSIGNWGGYVLLEIFNETYKQYEGRVVGEVAAELNVDPWDLLCDIVVADKLLTVIANQDKGQDRETWDKRVQVWRDHRAVVGASDAGAHLDMIDSYAFSTTMLARAVREHNLMPIEEAVYHLTERPARLYGLKNRGRLAKGWAADITIFDPATVGPGPAQMRFDLPGGAGRVYGESIGVEHVIVNGVPAVQNNVALDARPGTLLRSGRDTETVTAQ